MSTRNERPEECEACGHCTKKLKFFAGSGRQGPVEDVPVTMRARWLCRLCGATAIGYEVHRGNVTPGLVQSLNVILETLERRPKPAKRRRVAR